MSVKCTASFWADNLRALRVRVAAFVFPAHSHTPAINSALQSADHAHLIASYLRVNDLLTASTLSRSLHAVFDSDAVWRDRLKQAERLTQRVDTDTPVPASDVLSPTQLATLPPLPSLTEAAELCVKSVTTLEQERSALDLLLLLDDAYDRLPHSHRDPPEWVYGFPSERLPRLTAFVHLPSTLTYHARIYTPSASPYDTHRLQYIEFTLAYSEQSGCWAVDHIGDEYSGWRTINMRDNVDVDEKVGGGQLPRLVVAPLDIVNSGSCKERYIDLLQCSIHVQSRCRRLLPPSPPLVADYPRDLALTEEQFSLVSRICPLPLCTHCRSVLDHYCTRLSKRATLHRGFLHTPGVTRVSSTLFEFCVAGASSAGEDDQCFRVHHSRWAPPRQASPDKVSVTDG